MTKLKNLPTLEQLTRQVIRDRIATFDGNFVKAAQSLGVSRQTIWNYGFRKRVVKVQPIARMKRTNEVYELNGK